MIENNLKRKITFSPPDISDIEINEVVDTLKSGWITTGPKVKLLEKKIAEHVGAEKCVCLNSQTACQELVLRVLGIGPGDEVILPAYTYSATCSVVCHVGATPIMIDCEKDKYNMDYDKLANAITEKTKVIMPVDLFGIPVDYDRIFKIVEEKKKLFKPSNNEYQKLFNRIIICSDTAHSFGATYKDRKACAIADFSSSSFHAVKSFTTAEGGAITWPHRDGLDGEKLYKEFQLMSLHGQNKDALSKTKLGSWEYDILAPLYKCNMTDVHAAIGLGQLTRYDKLLARRKEIIKKYEKLFNDLPVRFAIHYTEEYYSTGYVCPIRLYTKDGKSYEEKDRNRFIEKMGEMGVACNVHFKPLPMLTAYKNLGFDIKNYSNAYNQYKNLVSLPIHTLLTDDDVEYVSECVHKIYGV